MFVHEILADNTIDWQNIEQKYNYVYEKENAIPDWLFYKIREQL
ncbi:MAG: hypothetical protein ACREPR_08525 [Brasilonema sp.]